MPQKIIKFRNKETGLIWEVSQVEQAERLSASKDFEIVEDAPPATPPVDPAKAAADKAAADKAAADKAAADKAAADKAAADTTAKDSK